ncbi:MAG: hypothetical protein ACLTYN_10165 [Dysosmobacter welbionis]
METEKLYYQDPYLTAFTARVLSCEKSKSGWAVVLDRTAFYPERRTAGGPRHSGRSPGHGCP